MVEQCKIDRITRWPLDQFTGWTRAPSRTYWATGPSATRDAGWPANNGRARLVPLFGSGESRLHWQLGYAAPSRLGQLLHPGIPPRPLPRVVARSGAFSLPRLVHNPTPNTPPTYKLSPHPRSLRRLAYPVLPPPPPVRALAVSQASHPFTASSYRQLLHPKLLPCFSCANPSSCLAALC